LINVGIDLEGTMPAFCGAKAGLTTELDEGKGSNFIGKGREPWLSVEASDSRLSQVL